MVNFFSIMLPDSKRVPSWHRIIPLLSIFSSICQAALVNRTIDDTFGDSATGFQPIYNPSFGSWEDQTCSGCAIQPDRSSAFDGTWTAATYNPGLMNISITLEFTGVSVWVFFILSNANEHGPNITTNTNCNFTLDGSFVGTFVHQPDMSTYALVYNATAFFVISLSNTPHQLIISTNDVSFVNFDYAIYTAVTADSSTVTSSSFTSSGSSSSSTSSTSSNPPSTSASTSSTRGSADPSSSATPSSSTDAASNSQATQPSSSSSSSLNVSTIIGPVLGGVTFIIIIIVLVFFLFRRRSTREKQAPMAQPLRTEFNPSFTEPYRDDVTTSHLPGQHSVYSGSQRVLAGASNSGDLYTQGGSQPASTDALATASLLPVRRDQAAQLVGSSNHQDEIRAMRQMEINQRLQSAQRQMENLTSRQSMPPPNSLGVRPPAEDREMEDIREQIRMLRSQIGNLQMERQSDWAMGLSDEPPPAYAW